MASSDPKGAVSASTLNSPGAPTEFPVGRRTVQETGRVSDRVNASPRPTPEGPARDNPIAGPQKGTTRSEHSTPASAGASGRHNEPGSRPASACPAQPPSKAGGGSPRLWKRHYGVIKADRSTESDRTGQGEVHDAEPPGTPERHAAGHNEGTQTSAKQQQPTGAANPDSAHRNRCQETPSPRITHCRQEWRGTSRARTQGHTHPDIPARSGGAQPKPEPRHTRPRRTPGPGVAGYKRSAHANAHTAHRTSQESWGAAETGAQVHTPTPHTRARIGGVQRGRAHKHTHTATPQPRGAGRSQNPNPSTHTNTAHPSQECRGTTGARTQTRTPQHPCQERRGAATTQAQPHTPTPHTPARSGRVQAERAHKHTHTQNTPTRGGRAQPQPELHHTRPHRTP